MMVHRLKCQVNARSGFHPAASTNIFTPNELLKNMPNITIIYISASQFINN
jgi:hypothetical protein